MKFYELTRVLGTLFIVVAGLTRFFKRSTFTEALLMAILGAVLYAVSELEKLNALLEVEEE